ncbi:MAG: VRR-NUC domain-containing protein [Ignavibacteriales bacterium]
MTERQLTKLIMDYLAWISNSTFKKIRGSMGIGGILDIIGCWQGRYAELEVKTERGRLTPEQKARIEEIRKAGGIAEVVRSLEEVHSIFNKDGRITIDF